MSFLQGLGTLLAMYYAVMLVGWALLTAKLWLDKRTLKRELEAKIGKVLADPHAKIGRVRLADYD